MTKPAAIVLVSVASFGSCSYLSGRFDGPPPAETPATTLPIAVPSEAPVAPPPPPFGSAESLGTNIDTYMAGFGSNWGDAYAPSVASISTRPWSIRLNDEGFDAYRLR